MNDLVFCNSKFDNLYRVVDRVIAMTGNGHGDGRSRSRRRTVTETSRDGRLKRSDSKGGPLSKIFFIQLHVDLFQKTILLSSYIRIIIINIYIRKVHSKV